MLQFSRGANFFTPLKEEKKAVLANQPWVSHCSDTIRMAVLLTSSSVTRERRIDAALHPRHSQFPIEMLTGSLPATCI